jgi:outer membrane lipoprotein SlyB
MKTLTKTLVATTFAALTLVGCAPSISPDTYTTSSAGQVNRVIAGRIVSARPVHVSGDTYTDGGGMVGTLAGGAAGAIAGSSIGGGRGSLLAGLGGALIGAGLGNMAEKKLTSQEGMEYIIKTKDGQMLTIVQSATPALRVGQHVLLQYGGNRSRLIADPSYAN